MMEKCYVIKFGISDPYYIAKWDGDPGRTYSEDSAMRFLAKGFALNAAKKIIAKYPERYNENTHFEIVEIEAD